MGNKFIFQQSLFVILLVLSATVHAATGTASSKSTNSNDQDSWFQIEIIIFENVGFKKNASTEVWPSNPGLPDFGNALDLTPSQAVIPGTNVTPAVDTGEKSNTPAQESLAVPDSVISRQATNTDATSASPDQAMDAGAHQSAYQLLTGDDFNLTQQEIKLSTSEKYYPLLHIAWRQPVLSENDARAVHIYSNMEHTEADDVQSSVDELAKPPTDEFFSFQNSTDTEAPMNVIDGTIKISREKYLHLDADILYRTQPEEKNDFSIFGFKQEDESANVFRMRQSRRLRSGELNYFDHPLFGMLVLITPYASTDQPVENTDTAAPLEESVPGDEQDQDTENDGEPNPD